MIRLMEERDIPQVAELERLCFSTPWSENSLKESLVRPEYLFLVEKTDGKVTAYGGLLQVMEEGDVTNIAVHPQHRLKGSGTRVTEALLEEGRKRGMTTFTLEVRVSNLTAVHVYEKLGFRSVGIRKGFYDAPKEDAMVMWQ